MSDTEQEYFESIEDENEHETPIKAKPAKKKRVLTEEQRQRNIENLRKGREKALANRKKKAELKKLEKQNMEKNMDARLKALKNEYTPVPKSEASKDDNMLLAELKALRNELNELKVKPKPSEPINIPKPKIEVKHEPVKKAEPVKNPEVKKTVESIQPSKPRFVPLSEKLNSLYKF